ncbi:hypothetical protein ORV05_14885 [Amycolatopsis cynarae]|uniref:Uncharacterized protein n=1 Tax=Amycolatopsis cynarae TaxID=2995223 RepID=A0ABY7BAJ6_9PSEU|nr:hypothetical protein [Amycolatopsis sp. HUAS 11-8]WAL68997.1 hypothetical protein ORV05_14885 [Amycolatopsis sp. HUAS 11-8]
MDQERSEQQENLELAPEPEPLEDPVPWRAEDPDYAREPDSEESGGQFTPSPGSPGAADQERFEHPAGGAEQQSLHVRRP